MSIGRQPTTNNECRRAARELGYDIAPKIGLERDDLPPYLSGVQQAYHSLHDISTYRTWDDYKRDQALRKLASRQLPSGE